MRASAKAAVCATVVLLCAGGLVIPHAQAAAVSATPHPAGRWQEATLDDYRKHLTALAGLTQVCAQARDLKSCDPMLVGLDDRVPLGAKGERRLVRYGWLRVLFSRAEESDQAQQAPQTGRQESGESGAQPKPRTTSQLLQDAIARLQADLAEAGATQAEEANHAPERATMQAVLAGREFRGLKQLGARDSFLERVNRWVNRLFEGVDKLRSRSRWVGRVLIWGFLLAVGVGLAWMLLQLERRWRIRLLPESEAPAADAASARDWQLWMADARAAGARAAWRDGIHCLYWAVISRLESKRLWPADRARTPREYLALLAAEDPRRPGLAMLTGSFERVWYGGRATNEAEFRRAEELAGSLIAGSAAAASAPAIKSGQESAAL
ncbi:DUF4129 domain-containing protein [Acidobacteria bacterium AB60]|nr:DUF4129 domain-containing protein [Acidobacteria bacterium AB60]